MTHKYPQEKDECCILDLLSILEGHHREISGDCCDQIKDALEYIHKHLDPVQSTGGRGRLGRIFQSGMDRAATTTRLGLTALDTAADALEPSKLARGIYDLVRDDTEEEKVSLAQYNEALQFKPSLKSMDSEIKAIKNLMVHGKFDEVTVLANNIVSAVAAEKNAAKRLLIFKAKFLPLMYAILSLPNKVLKRVVDYNLKVWGIAPATQITQVIITPFGTKVPPWFPIPKDWTQVGKTIKQGIGTTGLVIAYGASQALLPNKEDVPEVDEVTQIGALDQVMVLPRWWKRLKNEGKVTEFTAPEHHGVYLGFGLVSEVGPSQWCKHERGKSFREKALLGHENIAGAVAKVCLTLSTLHDFVTRAGNIPGGISEIFRVKYNKAVLDTDNMNILKEQLKRALEMAFNPDWNYNLLEGNCQHWSSRVITGDDTLGTQVCSLKDRLKRKYIPIEIPPHVACDSEKCLVRAMTNEGDVCATEVKTDRQNFKKYCYLPSESPTTGKDWGYVSTSKKAYGCINPPLGTKGSQFYPCIHKGASTDDDIYHAW